MPGRGVTCITRVSSTMVDRRLCIVLSLIIGSCLGQTEEDTVEYYVRLITEGFNASQEYVMPVDLNEYKPRDEGEIVDLDSYDFIVVGSGSAGSVVAGRLSEIPEWNVLVLEAGEFGNDYTSVPRMAYKAYIESDYNWGYYSVPQTNACLGMEGRRCAHPRGKGVGGTSLINAVIYVRGNIMDFEKWCAAGNPGWCYDDVLPYFLAQEDYQHTDPEAPVDPSAHVVGGELRVEYMMPRHRQSEVFFEANIELGYDMKDVNSGTDQVGVSPMPLNTYNGRRWDGGSAFLRPFLYRPNLTVMTGSLVTKVIIEGGEARGVIFHRNGTTYRVNATKEVVLCGGAINTPALLMLSGVGPKDHLTEVGIETLHDLRGVGSNFSDHLQVYGLTFSSNLTENFESYPLRDKVEHFLHGLGELAAPLASPAVGYYATPLAAFPHYPDLELSFSESNTSNDALSEFQRWNSDVTDAMSGGSTESCFSIFVTPLHTKSKGTVRLNSSDPFEFPLIDPKCLTDEGGSDIALTYEGIKFALDLVEKAEAFKAINATLLSRQLKECADHEFLSKEYWYCAIGYITAHNNHPVSTCRMGPDPADGDVVNARLKVHGIRKLRIADASVIPISTSSHINAICYMIGEKLVDMLRNEYKVEPPLRRWPTRYIQREKFHQQ